MGLKMKPIQMSSKITNLFEITQISYLNSRLSDPKKPLHTVKAKEEERVAERKRVIYSVHMTHKEAKKIVY